MSDQPAGGTASTDEKQLKTYMKLLNDCRNLNVRVFPRYREMFPEGMKSMYSLDPTLANASLPLKIRAMRDHLDFLKSLDDSPLFDLHVHSPHSSRNNRHGAACHRQSVPARSRQGTS